MIASLAHGATISVGNYTMAAMVTSAGLSPTIPGYCGSILNLCSVLFTAPYVPSSPGKATGSPCSWAKAAPCWHMSS